MVVQSLHNIFNHDQSLALRCRSQNGIQPMSLDLPAASSIVARRRIRFAPPADFLGVFHAGVEVAAKTIRPVGRSQIYFQLPRSTH
jgi:hypothetical protein